MEGGQSTSRGMERTSVKRPEMNFHPSFTNIPAELLYEWINARMAMNQPNHNLDGAIRNLIRVTFGDWTYRFQRLPSLPGKTLVWLQLLLVDEQKAVQLTLYDIGSKVAFTEDDDLDDIECSRKLFKDTAPFFLKDFGLWILSRSRVGKGYKDMPNDTLDFFTYDPMDSLGELHPDLSPGIRCAEIFLFFAVDHDIPGDGLLGREAVMNFLNGLNSEEGTRKIHGFSVVAASEVVTREKVSELHEDGLLKVCLTGLELR